MTGEASLVDAADVHPVDAITTESTIDGGEININKVLNNLPRRANVDLVSNPLVNRATGAIDFSRASWTRASWTEAAEVMRASWTSAELEDAKRQCASVDTTRASWTRASWTRASWTASFTK